MSANEPIAACLASGRDERGRFALGNTAALVHGARSRQVADAQLPEQAEALAALAKKRADIRQDCEEREPLSTVGDDVIDRYLELDTIASWLGADIMRKGILTPSGRTRASVTTLLAVTAQQLRLAEKLGIRRGERPVSYEGFIGGK